MTNVDLARVEFAFVTINHFFLRPDHDRAGDVPDRAAADRLDNRKREGDYLRLTRFFGTLLVINVAIGVVDRSGPGVRVRDGLGGVLAFVGDVFGAPLAMEAWPPSSWSQRSSGCGSSAGTGCPGGPPADHGLAVSLVGRRPCPRRVHPGRQLLDAAPGRLSGW